MSECTCMYLRCELWEEEAKRQKKGGGFFENLKLQLHIKLIKNNIMFLKIATVTAYNLYF